MSYRQGQMYVTFGFMTMAYLILILLCAELSIIQCYLHLGAQDYRWWWRSFFSPGTFAFWFFLFSLRYFVYKTSFTGILSYLLFFGYTFIMVFLSCIVTGESGVVSGCALASVLPSLSISFPLSLLHLCRISAFLIPLFLPPFILFSLFTSFSPLRPSILSRLPSFPALSLTPSLPLTLPPDPSQAPLVLLHAYCS